MHADPPHWTETVGTWSASRPDRVVEYWTNQYKRMAYDHRLLLEAIDASASAVERGDEPGFMIGGTLDSEGKGTHADLLRHIGNAGRRELKILDDEGKPLVVMTKQDGRQGFKFDAAMALSLANIAAHAARKSGAKSRRRGRRGPRRIY